MCEPVVVAQSWPRILAPRLVRGKKSSELVELASKRYSRNSGASSSSTQCAFVIWSQRSRRSGIVGFVCLCVCIYVRHSYAYTRLRLEMSFAGVSFSEVRLHTRERERERAGE